MSGFKLNQPSEKTVCIWKQPLCNIWQQPLCNIFAVFTGRQYRPMAAVVVALKIKEYIGSSQGIGLLELLVFLSWKQSFNLLPQFEMDCKEILYLWSWQCSDRCDIVVFRYTWHSGYLFLCPSMKQTFLWQICSKIQRDIPGFRRER